MSSDVQEDGVWETWHKLLQDRSDSPALTVNTISNNAGTEYYQLLLHDYISQTDQSMGLSLPPVEEYSPHFLCPPKSETRRPVSPIPPNKLLLPLQSLWSRWEYSDQATLYSLVRQRVHLKHWRKVWTRVSMQVLRGQSDLLHVP